MVDLGGAVRNQDDYPGTGIGFALEKGQRHGQPLGNVGKAKSRRIHGPDRRLNGLPVLRERQHEHRRGAKGGYPNQIALAPCDEL